MGLLTVMGSLEGFWGMSTDILRGGDGFESDWYLGVGKEFI